MKLFNMLKPIVTPYEEPTREQRQKEFVRQYAKFMRGLLVEFDPIDLADQTSFGSFKITRPIPVPELKIPITLTGYEKRDILKAIYFFRSNGYTGTFQFDPLEKTLIAGFENKDDAILFKLTHGGEA